jgi:hypothetical protein
LKEILPEDGRGAQSHRRPGEFGAYEDMGINESVRKAFEAGLAP